MAKDERAAMTPRAAGAGRIASATTPLTRQRKWIALAIAAVSDLVQVALFPIFVEGALSPYEIALDVATAIAILLVCGFKWRLAIALATELVPAVDLFPTWTALVLSLPSVDTRQKPDILPSGR